MTPDERAVLRAGFILGLCLGVLIAVGFFGMIMPG